jgi:hypothetical protein
MATDIFGYLIDLHLNRDVDPYTVEIELGCFKSNRDTLSSSQARQLANELIELANFIED